MRSTAGAHIWVAEDQEIMAALCLSKIDQGYWLTSLLVNPTVRGQGVASQLMDAALVDCRASVWLFCHPDLNNFYCARGFMPCSDLPHLLAQRLARYTRKKTLLALYREGQGDIALAITGSSSACLTDTNDKNECRHVDFAVAPAPA